MMNKNLSHVQKPFNNKAKETKNKEDRKRERKQQSKSF